MDKPGGEQNFVIDVDDKLLSSSSRSISRADVANLCVAALKIGQGKKFSLDCITKEPEEGSAIASPEDALESFLKTKKVYNYNL